MFKTVFKPATLADNAMLHKDITQWLRNKTFVGLFFGLLALAEVVSFFIVTLPMERGQAGPAAFGILSTILSFYVIIIAISGYGLTAKEFQNRTFELYELSGMSLEKMIRGKFLSMAAQFLFGFFCIIPFMFFAYLLGGLDFYIILTTALWLAIAVPPFYLFSLAVALHSHKVKAVSTLLRVGAILFLLYLVPRMFVYLIMATHRGAPIGAPTDLIKKLVTLDPAAIRFCLVFLAFYAQVCLLLFYLCCNSISPTTDSREGQVKFFATTLVFSLMFGVAWPMLTGTRGPEINFLLPAFIIMCLIGLFFFWGAAEAPLMARQRREKARGLFRRFFHFWFFPGAAGTTRTLLLYWIVSWGFFLLAMNSFPLSSFTPPSVTQAWMRLPALPLALPFFVAFPACFLVRFKGLRHRPIALRMTMTLWWTLGGVAVWIAALIAAETRGGVLPRFEDLLKFLCLVVSPLSAMFSLSFDNDFAGHSAMLWPCLGVVGLFLMWRTMARRTAPSPGAVPANGKGTPAPQTPPPLPPSLNHVATPLQASPLPDTNPDGSKTAADAPTANPALEAAD